MLRTLTPEDLNFEVGAEAVNASDTFLAHQRVALQHLRQDPAPTVAHAIGHRLVEGATQLGFRWLADLGRELEQVGPTDIHRLASALEFYLDRVRVRPA